MDFQCLWRFDPSTHNHSVNTTLSVDGENLLKEHMYKVTTTDLFCVKRLQEQKNDFSKQ